MKQYTGIARQCRLVLAAMAALYFSAGLADESAAGDARSADGTDGGGETEGTVELDSMTITDRDSYQGRRVGFFPRGQSLDQRARARLLAVEQV